jgi:hypothetical protein
MPAARIGAGFFMRLNCLYGHGDGMVRRPTESRFQPGFSEELR